ncbi:AMP-binding protein [Tabrizicola sp.]|uniref:AMP-binding protein n=1 Tax=Tabrizicola sp. TaxID=2005166 RepID=UPI00386A445F
MGCCRPPALASHGAEAAIIHDKHETLITHDDLQARVARLAGALKARGITKSGRVIIHMPMVPYALQAMLAFARLRAIHSVVVGGFAAAELAVRIDDCAPKAIIATSRGIEPSRGIRYKPLLDAAVDLASRKPDFCVIL